MRRARLLWRFLALTFQRGQAVWCFPLPDSQRASATNTPKQMRVRRAGGVKEARREKGITMVSAALSQHSGLNMHRSALRASECLRAAHHMHPAP